MGKYTIRGYINTTANCFPIVVTTLEGNLQYGFVDMFK